MDLTQPKSVEERMREEYEDLRADEGLTHAEAIVEALANAVRIGYDLEHLGRAARALVIIDEGDPT